MRRLTFFICAGLLAFSFENAVLSAHAAQVDCRFDQNIADLEKIKSSASGDYLENIRTELVLRKALLKKIADCSAREVAALRAKVSTVSESDTAVKALKEKFLDRFDEETSYYQTESSRIDTLGITGSRNMAKALRERREGTYTPWNDQALNFLLWIKNQDLFKTARVRFNDIQKTIDSLQRTSDVEDLKTLFDEAGTNLEAAEGLNREAHDLLIASDSPRGTFDIIKQSLETLSKTYQGFLDISQSVQKVLPR